MYMEKFKEIVDNPELLDQLSRAGRVEQLGWAVVWGACLLLLGVIVLAMRHVTISDQNGQKRRLHSFAFFWLVCALAATILSISASCHLVNARQYQDYPKAMVLRDLADRYRF
jgi:hypothetical protein